MKKRDLRVLNVGLLVVDMELAANKMKLRQRVSKIRISPDARRKRSEVLCRKIERSEVFKNARSISFFAGLQDEPDLLPLSVIAKKLGKKIYFPVLKNNQIHFSEIKNPQTDLKTGRFGILEPFKKTSFRIRAVDLVLVPGRAFDRRGVRLGRGGGHYDRLLARWKTSCKAGIAFREQIVAAIPAEAHDISMDLLFVA